VFVSGDSEDVGSLTVTNSSISGNFALNEGGGIYVEFIEAVTISGTSIDGNTASQNGGGISSHNVFNLSITGSSLTNNEATSGSGGAVYAVGTSDVYIDSDTFTGDTAGVSGGAVYLQGVDATIVNVDFDNNVSYGGVRSGSDLFTDTGAIVDLNESDFDDTLGLSAALSTDLIDVGDTLGTGSTVGVISSSGGNSVWDSSWINITGFGFAGSGDLGNDHA
jgi:hypothetical protein